MGRYINAINSEMLPSVGKADFILKMISGAIELPNAPESYVPNKIVVVVYNANSIWTDQPFDAALFAYNENEFNYIKGIEHTDKRGRYRWLLVPNADKIADK